MKIKKIYVANASGTTVIDIDSMRDTIVGGYDPTGKSVFADKDEADKESHRLRLLEEVNDHLKFMDTEQLNTLASFISRSPYLMEIHDR